MLFLYAQDNEKYTYKGKKKRCDGLADRFNIMFEWLHMTTSQFFFSRNLAKYKIFELHFTKGSFDTLNKIGS